MTFLFALYGRLELALPLMAGSDVWALTNSYSAVQNNGNVTGQTLFVPGMSTITTAYRYDGWNRLAKAMENLPPHADESSCAASGSQWCRFFGYSSGGNGNRAVTNYSGQGQVANQPAGFNANNRIADGGWQYDARGNVIKQASGETFAYDAENRVVAYCPSDGNPVNCTQTAGNNRTLYYYDGEGHRVQSSGPNGTTAFVYDAAGNLAAEYGTAGNACVTCYVTTDHLGSTRVVTDQNGCAVFRQDYLPFGETVLTGSGNLRMSATGGPRCTGTNGYTSAAGSPVRQGFTGKERDSESGLDYFGARYMSSAQGRWTSGLEKCAVPPS